MLSIRKIGVIGRTYRNLNRYRQILAVLLKYGFGDLLELLKLDQYVAAGLQLISKKQPIKVEKLTRPQGLRMALEELGPTYIKLGQILSTRPDLIPVDFLQELSKLQDKVPPFPWYEARDIIEQQLGVPLEQAFKLFDENQIEVLYSDASAFLESKDPEHKLPDAWERLAFIGSYLRKLRPSVAANQEK